jgi:alkanesulfonate monooxygenase SsuD/methylene tetrahydromethanopterin reductase-like flavin-dependent oxidoreductase (luciferase family)
VTTGGAGARGDEEDQGRPDGDEPYSTHPVYIAMAAASLDEMYPGA